MNILVSMRIVDNASYPERRDALSHDWAVFFDQHSLLPILVPNTLEQPERYFKLAPQGLLLTGGDSLGTPDQPNLRDQTEHALITEAIAQNIPILGVCRGLQMLNRYFGGTVSHLPEKSHVGEHRIQWHDGTYFSVNSFHDDGVTELNLADCLQPLARAEDGVIEAVRHEHLPIIAIQWHPERINPAWALDTKLLEEWKNLCA